LTSSSSGTSFWIKADKDCTISFSGGRVSIDNFANLKTGWSQIGSPSSEIFFPSISNQCNIISGPWKYNPKTNSYEYNDTLVPGFGYWVKIQSPCTLQIPFPIVHGKYVDVDWSNFPSNSSVAEWALSSADSQYQFLARIQGIPLNRMRTRIPITLNNGIGGSSSASGITVNVDWFFGKNFLTPPPSGPSSSMSPADYSLQRLDAELYHEMTHYIPFECSRAINNACPPGLNCNPAWFIEGLGTWAPSAVLSPGTYTKAPAQVEDTAYSENVYSNPVPYGAYAQTSTFYWYLIDHYGLQGFHKMIRLSFGLEDGWIDGNDVDSKGFIPWAGKTGAQLSQEYISSIRSGWKANITNILSRVNQINQTNITCETNVFSVCTYVTPNNLGAIFLLNGRSYGDGQKAVVTMNVPYNLVATPPSGHTFIGWTSGRSVYVTNSNSPSTTVTFTSSVWDGTCIGNLGATYS
jgi:hypothetical protein